MRWRPALLGATVAATLTQGFVTFFAAHERAWRSDPVSEMVRYMEDEDFTDSRIMVSSGIGPSALYYFPDKEIEVACPCEGGLANCFWIPRNPRYLEGFCIIVIFLAFF